MLERVLLSILRIILFSAVMNSLSRQHATVFNMTALPKGNTASR